MMGEVIDLKTKRKGGKSMITTEKKVQNVRVTNEPKIISHVLEVARTFLTFESMNPKKLQKLCYYAYAWVLAKSDGKAKLFDGKFEAWIHGPVMPSLYCEYANYEIDEEIPQRHSIPRDVKRNDDLYRYLNDIYEDYGRKYDANQLEEMTHMEVPWKKARLGLGKYEYSNNIISDKDIISYFKSIH